MGRSRVRLHDRQHFFVEFGHEILSTAILELPVKKGSCQLLAKEGALSTGKLTSRLAQEQRRYVDRSIG